MKSLAFICALFAAAFMFPALASTNAHALGNCEDKIFGSGFEAGYYCHETEADGDTDEFCTAFAREVGPLSFVWRLPDAVLDCQCRKTFLGFGTHPYEFLCTGFEEEDEETIGLTGTTSLWWKGPINAEGVEVEVNNAGSGGGFVLKCRPDPSCEG